MKICKRQGCTNTLLGYRRKYCSDKCYMVVNSHIQWLRRSKIPEFRDRHLKNVLNWQNKQREKGKCVKCTNKATTNNKGKLISLCIYHSNSKKIVLVDQKSYNEVSQV